MHGHVKLLIILVWMVMVTPAHSAVQCYITVGVKQDVASPAAVPTTNKVVPVADKTLDANQLDDGMVVGRVVTENCTPVAHARVVLWYELDTNNGDGAVLVAGETYTNNIGEFVFFAPLPKQVANNPGDFVLNARVTHYDHRTFSSQLLFPASIMDLPEAISTPLTATRLAVEGQSIPAYAYSFTLATHDGQTKQF